MTTKNKTLYANDPETWETAATLISTHEGLSLSAWVERELTKLVKSHSAASRSAALKTIEAREINKKIKREARAARTKAIRILEKEAAILNEGGSQ